MAAASMLDVMKFFASTKTAVAEDGALAGTVRTCKPGEFREEWAQLTDQDKTDLKNGIGDGSLTY
jgi:hypothetical protein